MPESAVNERLNVPVEAFERMEVVCPAGLPINPSGLPGCLCRVEDSVIDAAHDPSSLASYCMSTYTGCPSWRADKEHGWQRKVYDSNHPERPKQTMIDRVARGEDVPTFAVPG